MQLALSDSQRRRVVSSSENVGLDELTDWILTFQANDAKSFQHAIAKWKETHSMAWLVSVLSHADKTTPRRQTLLTEATAVPADSAAYPTVVFHRTLVKEAEGLLRGRYGATAWSA